MNYLKEIKNQLSQKNKLDTLSKNNNIALKQAWLKDQPQKCEKCGRIENLTLDHIIPVEMINNLGIDEEKTFMPENYQIYCRICNQFKGKRLDFSNPKTKQILLKLLERI